MKTTEELLADQIARVGFRMEQVQTDVEHLLDKIRNGRIEVRPSFQRGYVWDQTAASQLIESIFMDIQMPAIQVSRVVEKNRQMTEQVIDGQQRCLSIYYFVENINPWDPDKPFCLRGLQKLPALNGLTYEQIAQLDGEWATKVISYPVLMMVGRTAEREKVVDLFLRLNRRTYNLNTMELRNAVFHSGFNEVIATLAAEREFLLLTHAKNDRRQHGSELLIRFLAFDRLGTEGYAERYPGKLKQFLDAETRYWQEEFTVERGEQIKALVRKSVTATRLVFGDNAFIRDGKPGGRISKVIAELMLWGFADLSWEEILARKEQLYQAWKQVLQSDEFHVVTERSTSDAARVQRRYQLWQAAKERALSFAPAPGESDSRPGAPVESKSKPDISPEIRDRALAQLQELASERAIYCPACQDEVRPEQIAALEFHLNAEGKLSYQHGGEACTALTLPLEV